MAKRSKWAVEDCSRLNVTRDLFRLGRIKFGGWSSETWNGLTWRTLVSPEGSFIEINGIRWELVPHVSSSEVEGARWYLRDRTGKRVTTLFVTPDGEVGSRLELHLKYRSQRLWRGKRLAWARAKVIERLEGPVDFEWVRDHPEHLPPKPKWMKQAGYRKLRKKLVMQLCVGADDCSSKVAGHLAGVHIVIAKWPPA